MVSVLMPPLFTSFFTSDPFVIAEYRPHFPMTKSMITYVDGSDPIDSGVLWDDRGIGM